MTYCNAAGVSVVVYFFVPEDGADGHGLDKRQHMDIYRHIAVSERKALCDSFVDRREVNAG